MIIENMKYLFFLALLFIVACTPDDILSERCVSLGGNWINEYNECEYISEEDCFDIGGLFLECESACRHDPKAELCTLQCVPVCEVKQ